MTEQGSMSAAGWAALIIGIGTGLLPLGFFFHPSASLFGIALIGLGVLVSMWYYPRIFSSARVWLELNSLLKRILESAPDGRVLAGSGQAHIAAIDDIQDLRYEIQIIRKPDIEKLSAGSGLRPVAEMEIVLVYQSYFRFGKVVGCRISAIVAQKVCWYDPKVWCLDYDANKSGHMMLKPVHRLSYDDMVALKRDLKAAFPK